MATARGVVTITDITDGLPTISIIQSNENHTFPATSAGVVSSTDRGNFTDDIIVLVGDVQASYVTITPTANNTYTIGTPTVTPAGGVTPVFTLQNVTHISGTGTVDIARMTISAINNTTTVQSATVSIPVIVRRLNQNVTLNVVVTLAKAVGGSMSSLVINATKQTFVFDDYTTTAPIADAAINPDIVITAVYDGPATGNISWTRAVDGGSFSALTPTVAGATTSSYTLTRATFGSANYITYEVSKGTVVDRISIVRLDRGEASFIIVPRVSSGSLNFKNNTGSATIVADLFKGGNEVTDYTGWTFTWYDGATAIAGPTTTPPTGVTEVDPLVCRTVTIAANYVPDNGSTTLSIVGTK